MSRQDKARYYGYENGTFPGVQYHCMVKPSDKEYVMRYGVGEPVFLYRSGEQTPNTYREPAAGHPTWTRLPGNPFAKPKNPKLVEAAKRAKRDERGRFAARANPHKWAVGDIISQNDAYKGRLWLVEALRYGAGSYAAKLVKISDEREYRKLGDSHDVWLDNDSFRLHISADLLK